MNRGNISITVEINSGTVCRSLTRAELLIFVLDIDAEVAEVEFTTSLLKRLASSLRSDLTDDEIRKEIGL